MRRESTIILVLNTIRKYGPINRYEIAKKTSLSPATITDVTDKLIKMGFISEVPSSGKKRGRRPINLSLSNSTHIAVGIEIDSRYISGVAIGLGGDILKRKKIDIETSDPASIFSETVRLYRSLTEDLEKERFLGLGLGIPGLIDPKNKRVIFSAVLGWKDVYVEEFLNGLGIPFFIEDNVRAITLGELWYGAGIGKDNLLCIGAGRGISAGIVINGSIYSGPNFRAGEFGHMVIEKDGRKCKCGNYGCLEPYVSTETIIEKVLEGIENNAYTRFSPINEDRLFEEIIQAGKEGDKFILNIFEEVGEYLGIGIANIINFFNPELIILADELAEAGELILEPVKRAIRLHALPPIPEITVSKLGSLSCPIGSATLVIGNLFFQSEPYKNTLKESDVII
ncbi:MAG TPA: ROK family transcriptional regulator [bacterium]|nr:ROK family transcriptional regulator [bacterium]